MLESDLTVHLPKTAALFKKYARDYRLEDETIYVLLSFFLRFLPGELDESTDREIGTLMEDGFDTISKVYGDILADFILLQRADDRQTKSVAPGVPPAIQIVPGRAPTSNPYCKQHG